VTWEARQYGYERHAILDARGTEIGFVHRRRDASLAAAAPDMRDALKRCTELLASAAGLPPKEVATALAVANAALARAES
jgi:hypothetical protein